MKNMIRIMILLGVLAVTGATTAFGEAAGYKCTIRHTLGVGGDGSPQPHVNAQAFNNKEFIVDRASGRMLGDINSQGWTGRHEVWDRGSSQQSYKSVYTSPPPFVHINLLQIEEFRSGDVKPFLLIQGTIMHTGTCIHLR
jgi:hypothetical protein